MNGSEGDALQRIRSGLGSSSALVPYAVAVVRHLATPSTGRTAEVVDRVVGVLAEALEGSADAAAESLLQDPELLASFFQNADLLDPRDRTTIPVTRLVMRAVEIAWDTSG